MKIFSFLLFLTMFLSGAFLAKANIINDEISEKYSQIFSQNILNDADVNNYKKYLNSKKSANGKKRISIFLKLKTVF